MPWRTLPGRIGMSTRATTAHNTDCIFSEKREKREKHSFGTHNTHFFSKKKEKRENHTFGISHRRTKPPCRNFLTAPSTRSLSRRRRRSQPKIGSVFTRHILQGTVAYLEAEDWGGSSSLSSSSSFPFSSSSSSFLPPPFQLWLEIVGGAPMDFM